MRLALSLLLVCILTISAFAQDNTTTADATTDVSTGNSTVITTGDSSTGPFFPNDTTTTGGGGNETTTGGGNETTTGGGGNITTTTGGGGNGTDTTTTGGTPAPNGNSTANSSCALNLNCSSCSSQLHCVWCDSEACVDGFIYGTKDIHQCKDWRWKQCKVNGKWILVAELGAIGLILLIILICMCKCCCCQRKKKSRGTKLSKMNKKAEREHLLADEEGSQVSSHPITDKRRAEMREKWGIRDKTVN